TTSPTSCVHSGLPAAPAARVWAEQSSERNTASSTAQSNANGHISPHTRATNTCTDTTTHTIVSTNDTWPDRTRRIGEQFLWKVWRYRQHGWSQIHMGSLQRWQSHRNDRYIYTR